MKKTNLLIIEMVLILFITSCSCDRVDVGYPSIADELNKIYNCTAVVGNCVYDQKETKTYGYDNGWLWSGSSTNNFTVAAQDLLISQAKQWAINNKPLCSNGTRKSIISIVFFKELVVADSGSNGYFIGCNVTYGCCPNTIPYNEKPRSR